MITIDDKYKIIGRAGTGKTTFLINEYKKLMEKGVPWTNTAMSSFTKAACKAFRDKALSNAITVESLSHFRTTHSWCFKLLEISPDNIFRGENFIKFVIEEFGLEYPSEQISTIDNNILSDQYLEEDYDNFDTPIFYPNTDSSQKQLSKLKNIYAEISRKRNIYLGEDILDHLTTYGTIFDLSERQFYDKLMEYMQKKNMYDFTRLLEEVVEQELYPQVDHIFLDEFQDFTPLQFEVAKIWMNNIKKVWVGGDDMQAINTFAGANPKFLIDLPFQLVALEQTYRHGKVIFDHAQRFVEGTRDHIHCEVRPADKEGIVSNTLDFHSYDPNHSTFLLAASNRWATDMKNMFIRQTGIEPIPLRSNIIEKTMEIYKILINLDRYGNISKREMEILLEVIPATAMKPLDRQLDLEGHRAEERVKLLKRGIKTQFHKKKLILQPYYNKQEFFSTFIDKNFTQDVSLLVRAIPSMKFLEPYQFPEIPKPIEVRFGTVHGSKGLEADTVFFADAVPYPFIAAMETVGSSRGIDAIMRIGYVGCSRAKRRHFNVQNMVKNNSSQLPPRFSTFI